MSENSKAYFAKYNHPNWQKKRLEIMQRDEFTCQRCGDKENQLQVHHKYYIWGNEPWEYPGEALITLCADCHQREGEMKDDMQTTIKHLLHAGYTYEHLQELLAGLMDTDYDKDNKIRALRWYGAKPILLDYAIEKAEESFEQFLSEATGSSNETSE